MTPATATLAKSTTLQLSAVLVLADGTTRDVSGTASWHSSSNATATVSASGLITALVAGSVTVTATANGLTGTTHLTVTNATLRAVQVSGPNPTLALGTTEALTATGEFSDGTTQTLTTMATWSSSNASILSVDNAAAKGTVTANHVGTVTITATDPASGIAGSLQLAASNASLLSIAVTPSTAVVAKGRHLALTATGSYSDHTTQNLSSLVTWHSGDNTIATVDAIGNTLGVGRGSTPITATLGTTQGQVTLSVTDATLTSIAVTPSNDTIAKGTSRQLVATGTYSDSTTQDLTATVSWRVSDATVVSISNTSPTQGEATGVLPGTVTITATDAASSLSGSTTLNISSATLTSIAVTPATASIAVGTTQRFVATGTYSDHSVQDISSVVDWTSSASAVATIANTPGQHGVATGVGSGTATMTATDAVTRLTATSSLTVTSATLVSIAVTPAVSSIAKGTTLDFSAVGTYSDGSTQPLQPGDVTWSSSNDAVATVSNDSVAHTEGVATGVSLGAVSITATQLVGSTTVTGTAALAVSDATLVSIAITPASPTLAKGTTLRLSAAGTYSDGSHQDLTSQVTWSSSDPLLSISSTGTTKGRATGNAVGTATVTALLGTVSTQVTATVTSATLLSIELTPASSTIAKGTPQAFTATGHYSDSSTQPLTTDVVWSSSAPAVATVSNDSVAHTEGVASGLTAGTTTITATDTASGVHGTAPLTVTNAALVSIAVTPANQSIARGTTLQFAATGSYSDGSTQDLTSLVNWTSSDTTTSVSNSPGSRGLATGQDQGTVTVTATEPVSGVSGNTQLSVSTAVLVSIQVTPASTSIVKGTGQQYTATGLFSDGNSQDLTTAVTWSSSSSAIASIDASGLATAVAVGQVTVTAEEPLSHVQGTASLSVSNATLTSIGIAPLTATIAKGRTQRFVATGTYSDNTSQDVSSILQWTSGTTATATVSNVPGQQGVATGVASSATPVVITATDVVSGISSTAQLTVATKVLVSIAVTPGSPIIAKGRTLQFVATGTYSDNSTAVITGAVAWSVVGTAAHISTGGLATGDSVGSVSVVATDAATSIAGNTTLNIASATLASLAITPSTASIAKGQSQQFVATGTYSDNTQAVITSSVNWTSSLTSTATISSGATNPGLATGVNAGSVTITATDAVSGATDTATLTVNNKVLVSIAVTPASSSIAKGQSQQFTATATYSDGTSGNLTVVWSSNSTAVTIDPSSGLAQGAAVGSATITATDSSTNISGSTVLNVSGALLSSIQVAPQLASIVKGATQQFVATGFYTDGSQGVLTSSVNWTSSDGTVATIGGGATGPGLAKGVAAGSVTLTATDPLSGLSDTATLTVQDAVLVSLTVSPQGGSVPAGSTQQFTATGTYSDGSTAPIATGVNWTSSNTQVATVDLASGLATTHVVGATTITATAGTITATASLVSSVPVVVSIAVDPPSPSIANGSTQQFVATATYTDGSTANVTSTSHWDSGATSVATLSNVSGTNGLASSHAAGTASITATLGSVVSPAVTLTVTNAVLQTITVTPATQTIAGGSTVQYTATGNYSDGTHQPLLAGFTWGSSVSSVATISSSGLATGGSPGATTISATDTTTGVVGSTSLGVSSATLNSLTITPVSPTIAKGTTKQFTATGNYSDGSHQDLTTQASWTSGTTTVASVGLHTGLASNVGLVTGTSTIGASFGGKSDSTTLTVSSATLVSIAVNPPTPTIASGSTQQFTAQGTFSDGSNATLSSGLTWTSGTTTVASINSAGLATSTGVGGTVITAKDTASGITGNTTLSVTSATLSSITITPANPTIGKGTNQQFLATGNYSDGSTQNLTSVVTWSSGTTTVASISSTTPTFGLASNGSGQTAGTSVIGASFGGKSDSTLLTVSAATLVSLAISPSSATITQHLTQQYTAIGTFSDGSTQNLTNTVSWNAGAGVTIDTSGLATGNSVSAGVAVTASLSGVTSNTATLKVIAPVLVSIAVTPNPVGVYAGAPTAQATATGTFSDNTTQVLSSGVTWLVADTSKETVSSSGLVTWVANGNNTIYAIVGSVTGSGPIVNQVLISIAITPNPSIVPINTSANFVATGTYSDGTTLVLTTAVTWAVGNTSFFTVSNTAPDQGKVTYVALGTTTLTATLGSISGTNTLTSCPTGFTVEGGHCATDYVQTISNVSFSPNSQAGGCSGNLSSPPYAYSDGSSIGPAFTFTYSDIGAGLPTPSAVTVTFEQGINCNETGSDQTSNWLINGTVAGTWDEFQYNGPEGYLCQCQPPTNVPETVTSATAAGLAAYQVNGTNTIRIQASASNYDIGPQVGPNTGGGYAKVHVVY